jgi:hypothetical protein
VWIVANTLIATVAAPAVAAALKPPLGVTATPVSGTEARISCQAVRGATDYDVLRASASAGPYSFVGNTTGLSYVDNTLTPGTPYWFVVRSRDYTRVSANSEPAALPPSMLPPVAVWHTAYPDRATLGWTPVAGAVARDRPAPARVVDRRVRLGVGMFGPAFLIRHRAHQSASCDHIAIRSRSHQWAGQRRWSAVPWGSSFGWYPAAGTSNMGTDFRADADASARSFASVDRL